MAAHSDVSARIVAELVVQLGCLTRGEGSVTNLTFAQWTALRYFSSANRFSRTVSAFAEFHGTTRGTASQTIKSLVQNGYLTRKRSKSDGRSIDLTLTGKSKKLLVEDPFELLVDAASSLSNFVGGQIQEFRFSHPVSAEEIRGTLNSVEVKDAVIQTFEQYPENILIRTPKNDEATFEKISEALRTDFPENTFDILRVEKVGPVVGQALRLAAILAFLFALAGILLYVGIRFKHFDFAVAGIIALLHDVFITLGILILLNRQVDLLVVTALLTIAGYSINDTIIIYDRVRENLLSMSKQPLGEIINKSINQTLGRTILTTITTLLVVSSLYLKGGEILNTFALTLLIGFIAGTYSTIFIASPLVLAWEKKKK